MTTTKQIVQQYIHFCNKNKINIQRHQIYGILWCIRKEKESVLNIHKYSGGIIADEMGMGKTIQMIATITLNYKQQTLIILPPILLKQWYLEIWRIIGHKSCIFYGKHRENYILTKASIIITSYDTFLRSPELLDITWNRVICDEAHRLRNPKTKLYKKIQLLRTEILWCITGTPIHNKVRDIISLFDLYLLEPSKNKTKSKNPEDYISMILCRNNRTLNIPKKTEIVEMIPWTDLGEWKLATDIHSSILNLGFNSAQTESSFWYTKNVSELVSFIRAKQLCILPKLLEKPVQKIEKEDPDDLFPDEFKSITATNTSCKLRAIIRRILFRINNGKGKIIFCHFQLEMTKITEILRESIRSEEIWIGNWKEFQKKDVDALYKTHILILQIKTGCEGLNLQKEFSEIYFVSPNWNPTLEDQAVARCHRIGQQNEVHVFRFYMDSLLSRTELIDEKQKRKDILKYSWIMNRIPKDIHIEISQYLRDDSMDMLGKKNYSMDQYTLFKQKEKKQKIMEFMEIMTKK